jgi:hypothetical protein
MEGFCFVIQPFDEGKFDKRYTDVFEPAIKATGLEPYRVDKDLSARIPIETIEEKISNSRLCLADITTDNPNVWYEVGFAFAKHKDVILMCSNERQTDFPFDIRHRHIVTYKTDSPSDFLKLKDDITANIKAILSSPYIITNPVTVNEVIDGLDSQEIAFIKSVLKNQNFCDDGVSTWNIKEEMGRGGYNVIGFSLAARKLLNKGMIRAGMETDAYNDEFPAYFLTNVGEAWILENSDKFDTRVSEVTIPQVEYSDSLPF